MSKNIFVFIVCGAKEHIETLHFSMKFLKKFSKNEIYVVTDKRKNEILIDHDTIIDIHTPEKFNNHQASIYLKTGIHKFLPKGNNYCYLDTDVIALSEQCDAIFDEFIPPIRFAPDHCRVNKFSPYAVNCNCSSKWEKDRSLFNSVINNSDKNKPLIDPYIIKKKNELQLIFDAIKSSKVKKVIAAIKYLFSFPVFQLDDQFYFDKKKRTWQLSTGEIVLYEVDIKKMERETGLHYNKWKRSWLNDKGDDIWKDECNHLTEFINEAFNIKVAEKNWQHWNGGVFLFNDSSLEFLESWHKKTMTIFNLANWKTRDQGTLIATVWELGLQDHPVLDKKWNFLADRNNNKLDFDNKGFFTDDNWETKHKVVFSHIYHSFGDSKWELWKYVANRI